MNSTFEKTSFTLGELSARALGRFDQTKPIFRDGAAILENFLFMQNGPAYYRPGSQYVATAGQVAPVRLEPFIYSINQSYILEFGNQYLRFFANGGIIESGGSPVVLSSPYFQPDLWQLQTAQKQDVSYITHPNYPPYKLVRTSANSFSLQQVNFLGGPFLNSNVSDVTITPSADTGATTLTATIPAWAANTQYIPGDYVTFGGSTYICIQTNYSGNILNLTSNTPTTIANDSAVGTLAWNLTGNTAYNSTTGTVSTEYLKFTNFGFAIPAGATIIGVVVNATVVGSVRGPEGIPFFTIPLVYDNSIKLVKGGTVGGTEHANGQMWGSGDVGIGAISPTNPTVNNYGTASDMWGETLTPTDVNASGFGVALSASILAGGTATVNSVSITVYYTTAAFANDLAAGYWKLTTGLFQPGHVGSIWQINNTVGAINWAADASYPVGFIVYFNGVTYKCLVANTSSSSFLADLAAGDWVVFGGTVLITGYTSPTVVTGVVQGNANGDIGNLGMSGAATTVWAEGAWSNVRGWPTCCCFHEDRLVFANTTYQPNTFWGSAVGGYENFSPGATGDSDAYNFTSSVGQAIRWLKSTQQGLRMGTTAGTVTAADDGNAGITPSSPPTITLGVDYAVSPIDAQLIGAYAFFIQANLFQLRQLAYDWTISSDKSEDMTLLADHILRDGGGAVQMARQESPNDRLWIPRADGQMAILTRNVEQQVFGWTRFIAGATSGGNGTYNSVAIEPVDGGDDAVYVSVSRVVNGTPVQFIEMFTPELFQNPWEPCRLDASVSINNPITVTGISVASPGVVTAPSHGLSNGQRIRIDGVVGMTFPGVNPVNNQPVTESINGFPYLVANVTTNTFTLTDEFGTAISTVLCSPYLSGGQVRAMETTFSGLSYLNGEYVSVVTDSGLPAAQQTFLVAGGQITLPNPAAVVHIGLPYTGTLKLLPLGEAIQGMTTQTKKKKVYKIVARVWQSSGGQFGDNLNNLYKQIYNTQTPDVIPGSSPPLYTGDIGLDFESFFAELWQPILVQQVPLPYMLLALVIDTDTQAGKSE
jgi:hypothetical protein